MKYDLKGLKKKANEASGLINQKIPGSKAAFDIVSQSIIDTNEISKKALHEATEKTQEIIQTTMDNERTKEIIKIVSSTTETSTKELKKYADIAVSAIDDIKDKTTSLENLGEIDSVKNIKQTIKTLKGKDKIGMVGEGLATVGGVTAGAVASGSIASAAGATTLLGSTSLASTLGGVFVTTTPVGWVIGSAFVAGAAGYGLAKMVRSGSEQDQVRKEIIERLNNRLQTIQLTNEDHGILIELNQLLSLALTNELIKTEQAEQMIRLIEQGALSAEIALTRIKELAVSAGIIENISEYN